MAAPDLNQPDKGDSIKLAFASANETLIPGFLEAFRSVEPAFDLYVISEFPPSIGFWIPYHPKRSAADNLAFIREKLRGKSIHLTALVLQPRHPFWKLRWLAFKLGPRVLFRTLFYNENLNHFLLRPRSLPAIGQHLLWRARSHVTWQIHPGGWLYTWAWRLRHPWRSRVVYFRIAASIAGAFVAQRKRFGPSFPVLAPSPALPAGISVVIPSRQGWDLLDLLLPMLAVELQGLASEVIVIDNGSSDSTANSIRHHFPSVKVIESAEPLSFARAVNRGIDQASYSHVCLLNNDMELHPGFFPPLLAAFDQVPDLFSATAQIFFPAGVRREETGKAAFRTAAELSLNPDWFPVHYTLPLSGEDGTYVMYGSGGCSLFDTSKLRALGGMSKIFEPAYVEDLDLGFRAWQRNWPSVFVARACVTHRHRATTSRFYTREDLDRIIQVHYLRFLVHAIGSPELFRSLWRAAIRRLFIMGAQREDQTATAVLHAAATAASWPEQSMPTGMEEELILALCSGSVAVSPGRARSGRPIVVIATPYIPFPLAHGGAVRMYNLMSRAAQDFDQVLLTFTDELKDAPEELSELCCEIVQVRRLGSHAKRSTERPDVVEEFDSLAFRAALRQTCAKWKPAIVQLEFTQMAQYAAACSPAQTILVEHDITIDLYQQLAIRNNDWETNRQLSLWESFEHAAWTQVDCVVTMSEHDRLTVEGAKRAVTLANGVDLERFQPSPAEPDATRLLFIGSFAHLPNLLAIAFFMKEVWPLISELQPTLHVIAGSRPDEYRNRFKDHAAVNLQVPGVELEAFVQDVRPAYARAGIVIAPLLASAGTNIKILEAMAMGKAIVSTTEGVNGISVSPGRDCIVANEPKKMGDAILDLIRDPVRRRSMGDEARKTAAALYGWDRVAAHQKILYEKLIADTLRSR